jgi:hypothetical protein
MPGKTHKLPKHVTGIDDFDVCYSVHNSRILCARMNITVIPKILPNVRDRINFKSGRHSLWRIVKRVGFH